MTKRIISVLLALVLVLALSTSALAETLTIKDTKTGAKYEAYQVFKGSVLYEGGVGYLGDLAWGDGVDSTNANLKTKTPAEWAVALNATEGGVSVKTFADYVAAATIEGKKHEATVADGKAVFTDLETGYYFVKEVDVATGEIASAYILEIVGDAETDTKRSGVPTVEKDQNEADKTYYIGKDIIFTLTSAVPNTVNYELYSTYFFEFQDTMSNGLDFDNSIAPVVTVDGVASDDFTFSQNGKVLKWTCTDTKAAGIEPGKEIKVVYHAKLNADAVSGGAGNPNTVVVEYTHNPQDGGHGTTTPSTEIVFCIDVNGTKVDGGTEKKPLAGAGFILKNENNEYYHLENGIVSWGTEANATIMTSAENTGAFGFVGLESGTYTLIEKVVPAGYNSLADTTVVIESSVDGEGKVTFKDNELVKLNSTKDALEMTIENNKGTTLPETGGIGTTIFYLVGGLMMAAAVVLLVAKKRTVNE